MQSFTFSDWNKTEFGILMSIEIFDPKLNDSLLQNCYLTLFDLQTQGHWYSTDLDVPIGILSHRTDIVVRHSLCHIEC